MPPGGSGAGSGLPDRPAGLPHGLRVVPASNASPLTLDGTRTYVVGARAVAVIDPGPADDAHVDALERVIDGASASILLTHAHPDHADAAAVLARRVGAVVRGVAAGTLAHGEQISTDAGRLVTVATPGHSPDHVALHWPAASAVFCGDLMMGGQPSTLVAPPEGNLTEYLDSLARVRALRPAILFPTHGPPIDDAPAALDTYVNHRRERLDTVRAALRDGARGLDALVDAVYGERLGPQLRRAASGAILAYVEYLRDTGDLDYLDGWTLAEESDE